jgi:hypothetical protein
MNWNPNCYRCEREGWCINSLGTYIQCPVCHDNKLIRILKDNVFNLILKLFKFSSNHLKYINWVSDDKLKLERLYNIELAGEVQVARKLPFESYQEVFEKGNDVIRNKYAYKIVSSYVTGYTEPKELIGTALEVLTGSQDLLSLAEKTHNSSLLGRDTTNEFWKAVDEKGA